MTQLELDQLSFGEMKEEILRYGIPIEILIGDSLL
jgi:hypothetical protein